MWHLWFYRVKIPWRPFNETPRGCSVSWSGFSFCQFLTGVRLQLSPPDGNQSGATNLATAFVPPSLWTAFFTTVQETSNTDHFKGGSTNAIVTNKAKIYSDLWTMCSFKIYDFAARHFLDKFELDRKPFVVTNIYI